MTNDERLMQQALEALEVFFAYGYNREECIQIIAALRERLAQPSSDLDEMTARKDAAYAERNKVVAGFAALAMKIGYAACRTRTEIEGWSDDWHGCVYIQLPTGQVSWHYHDSEAELFSFLPERAASWDGHETDEKYRRVLALRYPTTSDTRVMGEPSEEPTSNEVMDFLLGEGPLDGVWFDEPHPKYPGRWWRAYVRRLKEMSAEPVAWWPAVENILNEYGLQAIDFVADFKEAMKQAEQEPVAWHHPDCKGECIACLIERAVQEYYGTQGLSYLRDHVTATPKRTPLTDAEIRKCAQAMDAEPLAEGWTELIKFARAIERAHGIGEKQ